jgi:hypothetical protein
MGNVRLYIDGFIGLIALLQINEVKKPLKEKNNEINKGF